MKKAEKIVNTYKESILEKKEGFLFYDELPFEVEDIGNALWDVMLNTNDSEKLNEYKKIFTHLTTCVIPNEKEYKEYVSAKKTVDDAYELIEAVKTKDDEEFKKYIEGEK